jgi:hypothetical protein
VTRLDLKTLNKLKEVRQVLYRFICGVYEAVVVRRTFIPDI